MAELPEGAPADKGISLDPSIPGESTFSKPVDDVRKDDPKDESMYRVEEPGDLGKKQERGDEIDHSDAHPSFNGLGKPNPRTTTPYPYRDGVPNAHNAAFLAEQWKLEGAPIRLVAASTPYVVVDLAPKQAANLTQILTGLDPKFQMRARKCSATLKRADTKNLRWIFAVDCGNGPKAVKVKAIPKGRNLTFAKLDLELSCSCKAWQWLGPEYHAKTESYQLSKLVGTASTPDIRDPERDNRVCKHVAAALSLTKSWALPETKIQRAIKKADRVRRVLRRAMNKRASQVSAALYALDPKHQQTGWKLTFEAHEGPLAVYVRAQGEAEGKARYQLRKEGQDWSSKWIPTRDLAGAMGRLGLDVGWDQVPLKLQAWLREI